VIVALILRLSDDATKRENRMRGMS
jgi:hypothetical protein